jgi:hypothetical protein
MVHEGLHRRDAAAKAGLAEHSLYQALRRPLVRALYNQELEVIRTSARAGIFHRLEELAAQNENKAAAVAACRTLEELSETPQNRGRGVVTSPGLAIVLVDRGGARMVTPTTIEHESEREPTVEPLPVFKPRPAD